MSYSPLLLLHIAAGTGGMLAGFVAVFSRKGSRRHVLAGDVFVVSMLLMAALGVYLAFVKHKLGDAPGGALTFYLVVTGWMTARRSNQTDALDWVALLVVLGLEAVTLTLGVQAAHSPTGQKYGYPPGPYFFLSILASIAILGDVRMLARHGISGRQRLSRHLWRMCFALFIAAASIFIAREQVFPGILRRTGILLFPSFLPLLCMIFWLIRVRFANAYKEKVIACTPLGASPQLTSSALSKS